MIDKLHFTVICPHCGKDLKGEAIKEISHPSPHRTFFYTESNHQLAFSGWKLESVCCPDALDGHDDTPALAETKRRDALELLGLLIEDRRREMGEELMPWEEYREAVRYITASLWRGGPRYFDTLDDSQIQAEYRGWRAENEKQVR